MRNVQNLIKYGAIAFAFFLIFGIFYSIVYGIDVVFSIFDDNKNNHVELLKIDINDNIKVLDIDIDKVELEIKNDTDFRIEVVDNDKISYNEVNDKLIIKEVGINFFDKECKLVIYVPDDKVFESIFINTAAGSVMIERLSTKNIDLDLGVGSVVVDYLNVKNESDINTGVGEFIVRDGSITNLELDLGVGDVFITTSIVGKSEINSGIGSLNLGLIGKEDEYKIEVDKGIGSIKLNGSELKNDSVYGTGSNYIDIDGGVGEIEINFGD